MDKYIKAAQLLDNYYENQIEAIKSRRNFTDAQLTSIYNNFRNLYSPNKLLKIPKYEVLEKVFDNLQSAKYGEKNSLIYELKNEGASAKYSDFGHIASQYTNHLAIYRDGRCNWKTGIGIKCAEPSLSHDSASDFAYNLLHKLLNVIINNQSLSSIEDYKKLSTELINILPVHSWLHKYLHLLMPDAFPQFHTRDYKIVALEMLGIEPINKKDDIVLAGQLEMVFHNMEHYHFYEIACLFYTIPGFIDYVKGKNKTPQNLSHLKESFSARSVKHMKIEPIPSDYLDEMNFQLQVEKQEISVINNSTYVPLPEKKKEPIIISQTKKYQRDPAQAKYALMRAKNKCEFMEEHWTFKRNTDKLPYTEAHHLIPIEYQDLFESSIDVPANIISLCSSCHNCVHYGVPAERNMILKCLFENRKDELAKAGISIAFEDLLKMYE